MQRLAQVVAGRGQKAGFTLAFTFSARPRRHQQTLVQIGTAHHVFIDIRAQRTDQGKTTEKQAITNDQRTTAANLIFSPQVAQHNNPGTRHGMAHGQPQQKKPREQDQIQTIMGYRHLQIDQPTDDDNHRHHHPREHVTQGRHGKGPAWRYLSWSIGIPEREAHHNQNREPQRYAVLGQIIGQKNMIHPDK